MIKIESLTNSSVLQIGSAGVIKPSSHLYNTGGFTGPAPELEQDTEYLPFVPLQAPIRHCQQ